MKIDERIKQGKIYLAMGKSRDEVAVSLPAGGCYGAKRIYYSFARSLAAASRKLNKIDCVDKCYYEYDEDSKLFCDTKAERDWLCDLTLDQVSDIVSSKFNIEV